MATPTGVWPEADVLRIEMLPAQQGDALWIEYGDPAAPRRVLVDGGTSRTAAVVRERIEALAPTDRRFELLIVTHIDTDHVGGVLRLLADQPPGLAFDDVWFNAWRHLETVPESSRLGPIDGEILSVLLDHAGWPWNAAFDGGPVMVPADGPLPVRELPGGLRLTLLSPGPQQLLSLRREWARVVQDAGLDPGEPGRHRETLDALAARKGVRLDRLGEGEIDLEARADEPFEPDPSKANGSTIAVLAEFEGASIILAGDAFADVLARTIARLAGERGTRRLAVDAFKLPHHGSTHNVSDELLSVVACSRYLFSTSGAIFGHPDEQAVARVILHGGRDPELLFNYRSDHSTPWEGRELRDRHGYRTVYPAPGTGGLAVDLPGSNGHDGAPARGGTP
jgi:beta-lactamase superfamily II metal-dependent hydrolase